MYRSSNFYNFEVNKICIPVITLMCYKKKKPVISLGNTITGTDSYCFCCLQLSLKRVVEMKMHFSSPKLYP